MKNKTIDETEEIRPGILADLDETGPRVSLDILNAARKVDASKVLLAKHAPVELELA